ncbi:hypothetical protein ACHWQZ_G007524 [Mnemiopsis leidyi]
MWQEFLFALRALLTAYIFTLLLQCALFFCGRRLRGKRLDQRNTTMYALVIISFFLTDTQLAINMWGSRVAGTSARVCKTWRGISVILYPMCMIPVTVLLWSRQRFFYQLNMIKRTASRCLICLSKYIIVPTLVLFVGLVAFFIVLYYTPHFDIMEYKVANGLCRSGKSSSFSSIFRSLGILCIIALHCILLYLFLKPLKENMKSEANSAGRIMEVKGSSRGSHITHFKSIKDLDHALIKKLAIITGVVIAADILCVALYVLLKKLEVDLSSQQLALDIQVVITSVSNVMCWKHWRDIIYPNRWVFCFQRNWRKRSTGGSCSSSAHIHQSRRNQDALPMVVQQKGFELPAV